MTLPHHWLHKRAITFFQRFDTNQEWHSTILPLKWTNQAILDWSKPVMNLLKPNLSSSLESLEMKQKGLESRKLKKHLRFRTSNF